MIVMSMLIAILANIPPQATDTIPKEIVAVLMKGPGTYPGESFELKVGPAPASFPKELLPAGTTVVLTAISDRGTTVVGETPGFTPATQPIFIDALTAAGWSRSMMPARGFVSVPSPGISVCREHEFAAIAFVPRSAGGSYVRASVSRDPRRQCPTRAPGMDMFFADIIVPELLPPAEVRPIGTGGGGGSDNWSSSTKLPRELDVTGIAKHYSDQLIAVGWKMQGRTVDIGGQSVTRFDVPSKTGDTVIAVLIVTALPNVKQTDVFLRLVRAR